MIKELARWTAIIFFTLIFALLCQALLQREVPKQPRFWDMTWKDTR